MLILRLAYRNLWRAPQRTLLTMGAMTTATAVLILTLSINLGFLWSMIITTTEYYHSHIQIVNPLYQQESDLHHTLTADTSNLKDSQNNLLGLSPRLFGRMLLQKDSPNSDSKGKTVAAEVLGLEVKTEKSVSLLLDCLVEGSTLVENDRGILLGDQLAKRLGVSTGDKLIAMGQGAQGSVASAIFEVRGIFHSGDATKDLSLALTSLSNLENIIGLPEQAHTWIGRLSGPLEARAAKDRLQLENPNLTVDSWREKLPQLSQVIDFWDISQLILICIFYFAVILIAMNTMSMAILERSHEMGVLKAIGLKQYQLYCMLFLEGTLMSSIAALVGGIIGISIALILYQYPIDLTTYMGVIEWGGSSLKPMIRAYLTVDNVCLPIVLMMLLGGFTSIWPAYRVLSKPLHAVLGEKR